MVSCDINLANFVTFYRVFNFDIEEYSACLYPREEEIAESEAILNPVNDPCTAVSIAKEEWESSYIGKYAKHRPYRVYYDKQNGYWLVKTSYGCLNIFGIEYFRSKSASAIIRGSDGKVLESWVTVN